MQKNARYEARAVILVAQNEIIDDMLAEMAMIFAIYMFWWDFVADVEEREYWEKARLNYNNFEDDWYGPNDDYEYPNEQ